MKSVPAQQAFCLNKMFGKHTVKKIIVFPVPSQDIANQTLPARETLISDIPTGGRENDNLFLQCSIRMTQNDWKARTIGKL
jgi:hypothetical protein